MENAEPDGLLNSTDFVSMLKTVVARCYHSRWTSTAECDALSSNTVRRTVNMDEYPKDPVNLISFVLHTVPYTYLSRPITYADSRLCQR
ncbi:hypothetical protein AB6A40_010313 [Gnathostoma spinigerum]|uniref:Uncharacterized protein n=1 Tax=Gnathostoma spinigerum TaxID=75299 RepID=A0ABD6EZG4_9BILA